MNKPTEIILKWLTSDETCRMYLEDMTKEADFTGRDLAAMIREWVRECTPDLDGSVFGDLLLLAYEEAEWGKIAERVR